MPVYGRIRRLALEGAKNFHDFGGYSTSDGHQIAWRRLFRSDLLADLTDDDLVLVESLGLRTIYDLRGEKERSSRPDRLPCKSGLRVLEQGFFPRAGEQMIQGINAGELDSCGVRSKMCELYRSFPTENLLEFRKLVEALLEPDALPILIHCAQGKDRTGFAAAVVLMALGVTREVILTDYMLSNRYCPDLSSMLSSNVDDNILAVLTEADPLFLDAAFRRIDEVWGSDEAFLAKAMGLRHEERRYLQRLLLEQAD